VNDRTFQLGCDFVRSSRLAEDPSDRRSNGRRAPLGYGRTVELDDVEAFGETRFLDDGFGSDDLDAHLEKQAPNRLETASPPVSFDLQYGKYTPRFLTEANFGLGHVEAPCL
jgi:hypothetical protein